MVNHFLLPEMCNGPPPTKTYYVERDTGWPFRMIKIAYLHVNLGPTIDRLLQVGADVDDDLSSGYTPLIHAIIAGRFSVATELLNRGANANIKTLTRPPNRIICSTPSHTEYYGLRALDICLTTHAWSGRRFYFRIAKRRSGDVGTVWKPSGRNPTQKEAEHRDATLAGNPVVLASNDVIEAEEYKEMEKIQGFRVI
ncbi:hypothetical protein QBC41DRAFT_340702 [Cercophora samala]|uniref:Ankyrin n=1 Tax=Cercophora samala TaxID=330535 RepID=A0AA39Z1L2_9PEZI|nr:hypothetical protein QBC41DRAFT_340702 [Cercophora samala]